VARWGWVQRIIDVVRRRRPAAAPEEELPAGVRRRPPEGPPPPSEGPEAEGPEEPELEEAEQPRVIYGAPSAVADDNYRRTFSTEEEAIDYVQPIPPEYVAVVYHPGDPPEWRVYVAPNRTVRRRSPRK
jgi:hypothetical protein